MACMAGLIFACDSGMPSGVKANPSGPTVAAGQATISGLGTPQVLIQQQTNQAIINWNQFNIGPNEVTRFIQPSSSSIALNRIFDVNPSQIFGRLEANGSLILLNRNGIVFGPNAQVNVNGLIASSLNLSNEQFLAGQYLFQGQIANGLVQNFGDIRAGANGVYLLAPQVENSGIITSLEGTVALGAGTKAYLSQRPDGQGIMVEVQAPAGEARNLGKIFADGGHVSLAGFAVNQEGLIQANTVKEKNGVIELVAQQDLGIKAESQTLAKGEDSQPSQGGTIIALSDKSKGTTRFEKGAVIDVSGGPQGGDGGFAEVSGANLSMGGTFRGKAAAGNRGGKLLIDPYDVTVDDSFLSGFIGSGLSEITIQADHDITVSGFFDLANSWTLPVKDDGTPTSGTLTFDAGNDLRFQDMFGTSSILGNFDYIAAGFDASFDSGTPWNIVGKAGKDVNFSGAILMATAGGSINLEAGRDINLVPIDSNSDLPVDPGFGLASSLWTTQGDITLKAGRHLRTPAVSEGLLGLLTSGIRLEGKGDLTIDALGGDWRGGLVNGERSGPGFLLTDGTANVNVPQGQIGNDQEYASLIVGKSDVALKAGKSIFLGLAQDKGVTESVSSPLTLTVDPANRLELTAQTGDIHLRPFLLGLGEDPIVDLRTWYPTSFTAKALTGNIIVERPLTFWPSSVGAVELVARQELKGDPGTVIITGLNKNREPLGFYQGKEYTAEELKRRFGLPDDQIKELITEVTFEVKKNEAIPIKLVDVDLGLVKSGVESNNASAVREALAASAQGIGEHAPVPVSFTAQDGNIENIFFELGSFAFKKNITIDAGLDLKSFNVKMAIPESTHGLIRAGRDIDMATVGAVSGILFAGKGTGEVIANRNLNLSDSLGIQHQLTFTPSFIGNQGGLLDIRVGGNLNMTQSRIVTWNGASINIRGVQEPQAGETDFFDAVEGTVNVGTNAPPSGFGGPTGILTVLGGDITIRSKGNVEVNRSRVATLGGGNLSVTTKPGNINAGFGGKDELVTFLLTNVGEDANGIPVIQTFQFDVPGSGLFTFHPEDPFPVVFPEFDTPEIIALKNEKIKRNFFGRNTDQLDRQIQEAVMEREPIFNALFNDFITNTPIQAGDITLVARNSEKTGAVVVPPAGIRGRKIEIDSDLLDLQGGTISGLINIQAGTVQGAGANSFAGVASGTVSASGGAGGGTLAPLAGSTGTVTTGASSTAGSAGTTAESAAEAQEEAVKTANQEVQAQVQSQGIGQSDSESTAGTGGTGLAMGRGVTIEVEVKEEKKEKNKDG
jgi:filamentous hemagglutinin family protein